MRHGVDETVADEIDTVKFAIAVGIYHCTNAADEVAQGRVVAVSINGSDDVAVDAVDEGDAFASKDAELQFATLFALFFNVRQQFFEQVDIQTTAKTAVGTDDDIADFFYRLVALAEEGMGDFGTGFKQVGDDAQDVINIGPSFQHGIL